MPKHGKNPSNAQKNHIQNIFGLDPIDWLVVKWAPGEIVLESRTTHEIRTFPN